MSRRQFVPRSLAALSAVPLIEPADVAPLSRVEALEVTEAIRQSAGRLWSQIEWAFHGRAWAVLGYGGWDAYVSAEFAGLRVQIPRADRDVVVRSLHEHGMSLRAIAAATGVPKSTVADTVAGVRIRTPEPSQPPAGEPGARVSGSGHPEEPAAAAAPSRATKICRAARSMRRLLAVEVLEVAAEFDGDELDELARLVDELAQWVAAAREQLEVQGPARGA